MTPGAHRSAAPGPLEVRDDGRPISRQARRFGIVGIINTAVDYVVFIGLTRVFSIPLSAVWTAKFVSGALAMTLSFTLNQRWVFGAHHRPLSQALKFVLTTVAATWGIQLGLVQLFSSVLPAPGQLGYVLVLRAGLVALAPGVITRALCIKTAAFALATLASLVWNFSLYRLWVFR